MQLEEGLAEAGGEGRGGLGDAALGAGQLGGEAGQETGRTIFSMWSMG